MLYFKDHKYCNEKKKNSLPSLTTVKPFALRLGTLQFLFQCFLIICATVHGLASEYLDRVSLVVREINFSVGSGFLIGNDCLKPLSLPFSVALFIPLDL